ncbi:hypothetical protein [Paracoccus siganidrum]|uniref:Uncharacterized protein n=1 Tax=Paracoccus siganidrum TaxID=1276757 RepID=A0A419A6X0_9RHOB|nr:hypothetical protein [Paracoccus siganidrum]RJL15311.1 hypothetical protein D3P05_10915 [Paracoccus siganidrum]RMC39372.1 hypothetical protein C9E82_05200 [Paracoccus siganidrum]
MRLLKLVVVLILAALIALVGYAYFGDMDPARKEIRQPIPITDASPPAGPAAEAAGDDADAGTETSE